MFGELRHNRGLQCLVHKAGCSANFKTDASRSRLSDVMEGEDLVDAWREENPYERVFQKTNGYGSIETK